MYLLTYLICFTSSDDSSTVWQDTVNYVMCAHEKRAGARARKSECAFRSFSFSFFFSLFLSFSLRFALTARIFHTSFPMFPVLCWRWETPVLFCSVLCSSAGCRRRRRRFTVVRNYHGRVMMVTRIVQQSHVDSETVLEEREKKEMWRGFNN